jgi:hypothetical protein
MSEDTGASTKVAENFEMSHKATPNQANTQYLAVSNKD